LAQFHLVLLILFRHQVNIGLEHFVFASLRTGIGADTVTSLLARLGGFYDPRLSKVLNHKHAH
jgi:hypothetical protein